jgi:sugar lactone lactonase YvrE
VIASADESCCSASRPALSPSRDPGQPVRASADRGSLSGPTGLAFDSQHRLWVANILSGTLVRFDPAQLAAGGAQVPAVVVSGAGNPVALAFDAAGSLWVSDNQLNTVVMYTAAQLALSGSPAPARVLTVASALMNPTGLAFDAAGNLWVANTGFQNLLAFSPAQLADTGSPAPHVVISSNAGSLAVPVGLAFDGDGDLWVVRGAGALTKLARTGLEASGAPAPSARLEISGHSLLWSAAFWPKPAGLPLN